jgi:hypothetical protein
MLCRITVLGGLIIMLYYRLRFSVAAFFLAATLPLPAQIVINEIHYAPDVKTELVEFIELHNAGGNAVNLSGWQFTEGVTYTIPNGTTLAAGGYLVVAQNPTALQAKFGVAALGPWTGQLSSEGEKITLKNASGGTEDSVEYQLGFPWPTVGDAPGYSIELINPAFDNNLGGNWRRSVSSGSAPPSATLIASNSIWKYFKGTSEASAPTTAWRTLGFNDTSWPSGTGAIGYGESFISTPLSDMQNNYTTVFLRKKFVVTNAAFVTGLVLAAQYDDGFKVWINGSNVANVNISTAEVAYNGTAATGNREAYTYDTFNLPTPAGYLVTGTNIIAVQAANSGSGSSDFFFDAQLITSAGGGGPGPTPGAINAAFALNAPPQIRQVEHSPNEPTSNQAVTITAKITDPQGVSSVSLQYQIVAPGNYIELTDAAYTNVANWITVTMNDAGSNGDALAGDSIYTAVIPASVQQHRRLIRYRITATDGASSAVTVPYADDPQPNFAYFCYNGVPAWSGAVRPGVTATLNFDTNVMRRLPAVHLISKSNSVVTATWFERYGGDLYKWSGALVYDGKVYDHIRYRARGGVWRYAMVKNMWKFDFNRGHDFQMRDDYGKKINTKWTKLNLGSCIQQRDFWHRGEQGMFESTASRLFDLAGVESFKTAFLQFRVIDDTAEAGANQYEGDFWGLYLGLEQENGRFLDEHGLPDGNFYKMEGGTGELNNLSPTGPTDKSDLNYILNNYDNATDAWWRTNWVLTNFYSYQTMVQAIHHYDINAGKNYFYYRYPDSGLWKVIPWDYDLTWAHNMYNSSWGGLTALTPRILTGATAVNGTGNQSGTANLTLSGQRPAFELEFRNRIREIRDLLFNTNQAWQLIDEHAGLVRGPTNAPTFLDADRAMWDWNPKMADGAYSSALQKAGQGEYYQWSQEPTVTKDFNGCIQLMKNYVVVRSEHLDALAADALIPNQPTATYTGPTNFPLNQLSFQCSAYSGVNPFAALKWRIGEVWDTNAPAYDPTERRPMEITSQWESGEIAPFTNAITIPSAALKIGHAYRVRVQMKDTTGRWSRWSAPVQFVVGQPPAAAALTNYLRLSELMFDPTTGSDYEFIEVKNISTNVTLDLGGATFTSGVTFTFTNGTTLAPGSYLLVIRNASAAAFRSNYGVPLEVPIMGPYSGSLANDGEKLTLKTGAGGTEIFDFDYDTGRGWPVAAAGAGHSIVPVDITAPGQATGALDYPGNWRSSAFYNGSAGRIEPAVPAPTVVLNEITAHTDYTNAALPEYDSNDWIELFNTTASAVGLTNWYLSDDPANLTKWPIPPQSIPARGFVSFDEVTGFHSPISSGFGLDKAGEQVFLSYLPFDGNDRVVDVIKFKGQPNDISLGRYPDGAPATFAMNRTRSIANAAGLPGLVITEVMYHPPDLGTNDNTRDEFVEIYNPTTSPITLQDADGLWRLDGGVSFTFPAATIIPANGSLLVVSFAPTDTVTLAAFRSAHGITNLSLSILGPYTGKLGNRSDRVALERPQLPDFVGDAYSWIIVDEMIYGNQTPWPATANGGSHSLQRLSSAASGNDPANWFAAAVTPGTTIANPDADGDGIPSDWETANGLNPNDPNDANEDDDHDGLTNWQEYLAGTNPQSVASFLAFSSVSAAPGVVNLNFIRTANRSYTIQYAVTPTGPWQKLTDVAATAITGAISVPDTSVTTNTARFYKLVTPALP